MKRVALYAVCLIFACGSAFAMGDWYVSPSGIDDPLGGSQSAPWRTITFALAQLSTEGHTIHVAAGTYSPATGESFPLVMEPRVSIVGALGGASVLDPGIAATAVVFSAGQDPFSGAITRFEADTRLAQLQILRPKIGVALSASQFPGTVECSPTLSALRVQSPEVGIDVAGAFGPCEPRIEHLVVQGASWMGVSVATRAGFDESVVLEHATLSDCTIGLGMSSSGANPIGSAEIRVSGTRFAGCEIGARALPGKGAVGLVLDACVFEGNATAVDLEPLMWPADAELDRCTVYANSYGLSNNGFASYHYRVRSSIVWGNTTEDLSWNGILPFAQNYDIEWSDVGAGYPLTPSNLTVPPGFVAPGDVHLAPSSQLVERGDPAASAGGLDLDLDPRKLDADGDAIARVDIGADEYNRVALSGPDAIAPGDVVVLSASGPPGWPFVLGVSTAPADVPLEPFGSLLLDPAQLVPFAAGVLPAHPQLSAPVALPSGLWIGFQLGALDPLVPGIAATSNRLEARVP